MKDRLAFFGPMASGKTWLADYLVNNHGYEKFGFATGVKRVARELFNVRGKDGNDRIILQKVGGYMRDIDPAVWINLALNSLPYGNSNIVIDDLRYLNEAEALHKIGFDLIYVFTAPEVRAERIKRLYPATTEAAHNSPSEQEWQQITPDHIVRGGNIEEAIQGIEIIVKDYSKGL